jgi:hypothetical protein
VGTLKSSTVRFDHVCRYCVPGRKLRSSPLSRPNDRYPVGSAVLPPFKADQALHQLKQRHEVHDVELSQIVEHEKTEMRTVSR